MPTTPKQFTSVATPDIRIGDVIHCHGASFEILTKKVSASHNEHTDRGRPVYVCTTHCVDPDNFQGPSAYLEGGWVIQGNHLAHWPKVNSCAAKVLVRRKPICPGERPVTDHEWEVGMDTLKGPCKGSFCSYEFWRSALKIRLPDVLDLKASQIWLDVCRSHS